MLSSWDLVGPRFWYPMSSLEQSVMELEHMSDSIMRSRSFFDMRRDIFADEKVLTNENSSDNVSSDIDTSTDMEVDDKGNEQIDQAEGSASEPVKTLEKVEGNYKTKETHCNKNKQIYHESCKVNSIAEHKVAPKSDAEYRNFSSCLIISHYGKNIITKETRHAN
ncbi:unnamed protein product [Peronospora farinosa]|uniref:Uncharacterized protein n=1 Tax=Peronospora farinosa TaxID=134698 RepID=A0ABN8C6B7_9STRA|nr:unnamed protein product [Peronospora farinosa]